ncbi:hypothetical protein V8G54_010454 [Vigna mungo]|uniref:Uncharacterized protein n=1 Tax=Vigna mungo TaxID=3915 RepID=A0AAQ3NYW5_VIGMU
MPPLPCRIIVEIVLYRHCTTCNEETTNPMAAIDATEALLKNCLSCGSDPTCLRSRENPQIRFVHQPSTHHQALLSLEHLEFVSFPSIHASQTLRSKNQNNDRDTSLAFFCLVLVVLGYVSFLKWRGLRKKVLATKGFHASRVIRSGSFGTIYKTLFESFGTIAAIKIHLHSGTITQLFGAGENECSVIMLATYSCAAVSVTLWSTFYLWLVL